MLADSQILSLPKVSLETKDLLPNYSGIYYIIDETGIVWYIGKAKNIQNRWQGKSHHRFKQLTNQKQKYFSIYYENINAIELDIREKQQIAKYQPHLNDSPVKHKKIRHTESLLRETVATISDFAFILGVEPPRREIKEQIGLDWLKQEKILNSFIIHICLDIKKLTTIFKPNSNNEQEALIRTVFNSRKAYLNKWEGFPKKFPFMYRLGVNGYFVEVNYRETFIQSQNAEYESISKQNSILGQLIPSISPEALRSIQNSSPQRQYNKIQLQRLKPYVNNVIPLLFNESINIEDAKQKLYKLSKEYKIGKRGIGSRSQKTENRHKPIEKNIVGKVNTKSKSFRPIKSKPINSDFSTIDELLISRGIEPTKYDGNGVIRAKINGQYRLELYLKCFNLDPQTPFHYVQTVDGSKIPNYNSIVGILKDQKKTAASHRFSIVYLLSSVEIKAWLLVEEYLQDFATALKALNNSEGVTRKFYVSPRKFIAPAKVNIKLEKMRYSAWIPFGMNEHYPTFQAARDEIKIRLKQANLPNLKLSFRREHITK